MKRCDFKPEEGAAWCYFFRQTRNFLGHFPNFFPKMVILYPADSSITRSAAKRHNLLQYIAPMLHCLLSVGTWHCDVEICIKCLEQMIFLVFCTLCPNFGGWPRIGDWCKLGN
jgi:hypothetical protein